MYRILGWDIGIKNLACCVVQGNNHFSSLEDIEVTHWEIINLTDTNEVFTCKECNKNAKYYKKVQSIKEYYCGVHLKDPNRKEVKHQKIKKDLYVFGLRLQKELDARSHIFLTNMNYVVIENQPSLQNPFMKSIQMLLYSWFLFHGSNVIMLNANSKTKVYRGPPIELPNFKNKYNMRKALSVLQCRELLKNKQEALQILTKYKTKCDDLCDAFLLACYQLLKQYNEI